MKFSKEQISNGIWILAIILIVFTPVGFHLRVLVSKLIATSADVVEIDEQKTLKNYHWNLVTAGGKSMDFQSKKGEVVLVNFWATWCPPCVAELPSLVELHEDYRDKVVFAFVASDERDKVTAFLEKKGYHLPVYFEASRTPDELLSKSIPATYIIDKSGKIVVDEKGAANWNSNPTRTLLDSLLLE